MRKSFTIVLISIFSFCLSACSSIPTSKYTGIDGIACVGNIMEPPPGLEEITEPALLAQALGASEKGKLCAGKVYRVTHPLTVYRVWDSANGNSAYGRWWSFSPPQGPRESYREANEICAAWSALDRALACTLKSGALIVIGPGQSASCDDGKRYGKSAANQVYLDKGKDEVENCSDSVSWPNMQDTKH